MAKRIRTRSRRLRSKERRRRLNAASLRNGEVIVLDRTRKRLKGKRSRNAISVEVVAQGQWGWTPTSASCCTGPVSPWRGTTRRSGEGVGTRVRVPYNAGELPQFRSE